MIIAPGKTHLAQWRAYSCSQVTILLFKLFGSLLLVSLKISTVWHQPLTAGCACVSDQRVGIASALVWSTFLKLQHFSLLNASLSSKLFRHLMANFHKKLQFDCGRSGGRIPRTALSGKGHGFLSPGCFSDKEQISTKQWVSLIKKPQTEQQLLFEH